MVCWLAVDAKHCGCSPRPRHSRVTDLVEEREVDVAGAGRQSQHTAAASTHATAATAGGQQLGSCWRLLAAFRFNYNTAPETGFDPARGLFSRVLCLTGKTISAASAAHLLAALPNRGHQAHGQAAAKPPPWRSRTALAARTGCLFSVTHSCGWCGVTHGRTAMVSEQVQQLHLITSSHGGSGAGDFGSPTMTASMPGSISSGCISPHSWPATHA